MSHFKTANTSSVVDLRSATDEKLPVALESLGYTQSFKLIDTRLAIGYLTAVTAALTFYAEKELSFEDALPYTKLLLVVYVILSVSAWAHAKYVEKSIVYRGSKNKHTLQISGEIDKFVPEYKLTFTLTNQNKSSFTFNKTLEFKEIFDKFGNLHETQLKNWINTLLESNTKEK